METLEQKQVKIAQLLKKGFEDPEKAKDEIEKILGKGHRSIKELTDEQANTVLEEWRREAVETEERAKKDKKELEETEKSLLPVSLGTPTGPLAIADERMLPVLVAIMARAEEFALKRLQSFPSDAFVAFGDNVCLKGPFIDRFLAALPLPIKITSPHQVKMEDTPNGYKVFAYEAEAINTLTGMTIPILSEESSEKGFYCTRYKKNEKNESIRIKLEPDQVNVRDVRMAAYRGLRKEAVKMFFGLRGLTLKEAKEKGLKITNIVQFKSGGKE